MWPIVLPALLFSNTLLEPVFRIENYKASLERCEPLLPGSTGAAVSIRKFLRDGKPARLVVNPETLETRVSAATEWSCKDTTVAAIAATRYGSLLLSASAPPNPLENDGIRHSRGAATGVFLTIDLCPSHRPGFDQAIFTALFSHEHRSGIPVGISVSGLWIKTHREQFRWLREQDLIGKIKITWINHTLTHPYDHFLPTNRNFLLEPRVNLETEVIGLELQLLSSGVTPSVFFRFPGLISSAKLIEQLRGLSLVALGSDAWLAKGQKPSPGSVILIHGNENEPTGVTDFLKWLAGYRGLFLDVNDL